MTGEGRPAVVLSNIHCGGSPRFVPFQHHTEHAGVEVDKEPIDQLQHRDAWAAGETEDSGQAVGLVHWDQDGASMLLVYILQHYSRFIMSGAMGQPSSFCARASSFRIRLIWETPEAVFPVSLHVF